MDSNYLIKDDGSFTIKNYNSTPPFSNFLPGISGLWGIPIWAFYVNRAQGVISFGIKDKSHSITEFFPANKAYWLVASCGFRTFVKINKQTYYEPFRIISGYKREEEMIVKGASLEISEKNRHLGLDFFVKYFTLPSSPVGGLVRVLTLKNTAKKKKRIELLDGLPRIIPFGSRHFFLKDLSRTLEAWMRSFIFRRYATFRLTVDPRDISHTQHIEGANFNYSFYEEKGKTVFPYHIVDPDAVFGEDKSYSLALKFFSGDFKVPIPQVTYAKTPCSFTYSRCILSPGEERSFYSVFGASFKLSLIEKFVSQVDVKAIRKKEKENEKIIGKVKQNALCISAKKEFNHYLSATYLDNVLRGGYPYKFDGKHTYYLFSRKHGDLERDYNRFKLLPSYCSEGEANYRDINQNRRMDLFFNPFIGKKNVVYFFNFIKADGYNPLVIKGEKLFFSKKEAEAVLKEFKIKDKELLSLMERGFYLGEFFSFLEEGNKRVRRRKELAKLLVSRAQREPAASFGEGYWIDHWRYNLDLIESFLYFYPDRLKELFLRREYFFWDDHLRIKERKLRYYVKDGRIYQGGSVEKVALKEQAVNKRGRFKNFLRTERGKIYRTNLAEKLLCLILNKLATLDPEGVGIEMEADKPGWCDSLNGLPALFGSSLCETLELKRACFLLLSAIQELRKESLNSVAVCGEVFYFFNRLNGLLKEYAPAAKGGRDYLWWDKANSVKEDFRRKTFFYLKGTQKKIAVDKLADFLKGAAAKLSCALAKAEEKKSKLYATYFTYKVKKYHLRNGFIFPQKFIRHNLPLFLEAPVHILRVEKKKEVHRGLKNSPLFDKELKMYRLNASLKNEPLEIGRSRVFVPGWLENESVWVHMEYKYLLEVLKSGLYKEFFSDFSKACPPFFPPGRYGRSILENSSFIVSSAYPDKGLWGKGFVARLTGATAELLNIWIFLCLGKRPFFIDEDNNLCLEFSPVLPAEMFTLRAEKIIFKGKTVVLEKNIFAFKLFSSILVVYHNPKRKDTFSRCRIERIVVHAKGIKHRIDSSIIKPPLSLEIRRARVDRIDLYLA